MCAFALDIFLKVPVISLKDKEDDTEEALMLEAELFEDFAVVSTGFVFLFLLVFCRV